MGRDDAVGSGEQRIGGYNGLPGYHIHRGATDFAGLQCLGKGFFVDQRTTGGIQKDDTVFHFGNGRIIDDPFSFREQGTVEGNHIGLGQQGIQIHIFTDFGALVTAAGVVCDDPHAQCLCDPPRGSADASETDDTHGFTVQFHLGGIPEAEIGTGFPFSIVHRPVVVADPVAQLQQQGDGELGNGSGSVTRHIAYRDSPARRGIAVDDVVAGGGDGDEFDFGAGRQYGFGDGCFVGNHDIRLTDAADDFGFTYSLVIYGGFSESSDGFPAQVAGVQSLAVENDDFH